MFSLNVDIQMKLRSGLLSVIQFYFLDIIKSAAKLYLGTVKY